MEKITEEMKAEIDQLTHYDMCYMWRFHKGNPVYFDSRNPAAEYFKQRLFNHFGGFTPEISKSIGW